MASGTLVETLLDALPQTQCTRCGYADCRGYAEAIAGGEAEINRCPPGGAEGVARLARLSGRPVVPLDPACGSEGPRRLALIDEAACIGCALCLKACPVDAIVGAAKRMHTVIDELCTGCELCVPACPVDCIAHGRDRRPRHRLGRVERGRGADGACAPRRARRARPCASRPPIASSRRPCRPPPSATSSPPRSRAPAKRARGADARRFARMRPEP